MFSLTNLAKSSNLFLFIYKSLSSSHTYATNSLNFSLNLVSALTKSSESLYLEAFVAITSSNLLIIAQQLSYHYLY